MSRATCAVRFNDGAILYTLYDGTSDSCYTALFATRDEPWARSSSRELQNDEGLQIQIEFDREQTLEKSCSCQGEPVEVCADYGSGWTWSARACRQHKALLSNYGNPDNYPDPYDDHFFGFGQRPEPDLLVPPKDENMPVMPGLVRWDGIRPWAKQAGLYRGCTETMMPFGLG